MAPESMAVSVRQREVSHNRNISQLIQATPTSQFIEGTGRTLSVNNKGDIISRCACGAWRHKVHTQGIFATETTDRSTVNTTHAIQTTIGTTDAKIEM